MFRLQEDDSHSRWNVRAQNVLVDELHGPLRDGCGWAVDGLLQSGRGRQVDVLHGPLRNGCGWAVDGLLQSGRGRQVDDLHGLLQSSRNEF